MKQFTVFGENTEIFEERQYTLLFGKSDYFIPVLGDNRKVAFVKLPTCKCTFDDVDYGFLKFVHHTVPFGKFGSQ